MERLIKIFVIAIFCAVSISGDAQYVRMNTDTKTIKQVEANTAAIVAAEEAHNAMVDTIKKKQSKLKECIITIATNKELQREVMKNISGFGTESRIYKRMYSLGTDIVNNSAKAVTLIQKSNLLQKSVVTIEVSKLVLKACDTGKIFADIVTNSTIANPVPHKDADSGDKDKHNLLNRDERFSLALSLLEELNRINRELILICYQAKYSQLRDLVKAVDSKTWYNLIYGKLTANEIIRKWNRLTK